MSANHIALSDLVTCDHKLPHLIEYGLARPLMEIGRGVDSFKIGRIATRAIDKAIEDHDYVVSFGGTMRNDIYEIKFMDWWSIAPRAPKQVIYNDPATIVLWDDGTKTVVKCHPEDVYDPEKGFLLCCAKKLFGNKGRYNDVMREHVPQPDPCEIRVGSKVYRMVSE